MEPTGITHRRLKQQRLAGKPFTTPEQAVEWLGAVQSQEYYGAQWTLGMRVQHATEDGIEQAFNEGRILRTHIMRPTWHFVTPTDIRWIMALTAPRVHVANGYMYRQHELDDAFFAKANDAIARALEGQHLTRAELGTALAEAGIEAEGNRLGYILAHAELDLLICSGPRRGKRLTYALLDERAPGGETLERGEALAELTRRYFTGHGPATERDFAWWSGLTLTEAREGIGMVAGELHAEIIDDEEYWFSENAIEAANPEHRAFLLPTYDELLVGYTDFDRTRRGGRAEEAVAFTSPLMLDGEIIGSWRRTLKRSEVVVELAPFRPLADEEREAVLTAAERYGEFLGKTVNCTFV